MTATIARLDATADRMADDLRALGWVEIESEGRWTPPDRSRSLPLAAAWERARKDAVSAWRRA